MRTFGRHESIDFRTTILGTLLFGAGALGTTLLTPLSAGALRIGDWVAHWFLVVIYLGQPWPDVRTFVNRVTSMASTACSSIAGISASRLTR